MDISGDAADLHASSNNPINYITANNLRASDVIQWRWQELLKSCELFRIKRFIVNH